jgi:ribose 5-phosphate isomerase
MKTKREVKKIIVDVILHNRDVCNRNLKLGYEMDMRQLNVKDYVMAYNGAYLLDITVEEIESLLILQ